MRLLGVGATARASFYVYNDDADVDALADALDDASRLLRPLSQGRTPTMPGLEDLYREIILDHYRTPRNRGELPPPAGAPRRGLQPAVRRRDRSCTSTVEDGTVTDIKIGGQGCSISQSSASMMSAGGQGQDRRRGPRARPGVQGDDVDPRDELDGDDGDADRRRRSTRSSSATSRRCRAW